MTIIVLGNNYDTIVGKLKKQNCTLGTHVQNVTSERKFRIFNTLPMGSGKLLHTNLPENGRSQYK